MSIPILFGKPDERFVMHRLKSTRAASVAAAVVAAALWAYQLYGKDIFRWDLFAVVATMAVVKVAMMVWYRLTD